MSRSKAARAREMARRTLAYRAWFVAPAEAEVPEIAIVTDARLQVREHRRQLRRAQVGLFDSPAPRVTSSAAA